MQKSLLSATCTLFCASSIWAQVAVQSLDIHLRNGQIHSYALADIDSITPSAENSVQRNKWYHTLENPGIADYLRDFEYDAEDYSYHHLFDYRGEPYLDARQDWPYGVTLGDTTYYNLIPGKSYTLNYIQGESQYAVRVNTLGQLRMIKAEGADNMRDLGGWPTADGHRVRYGRLYRGTELNTTLSPNHSALRSSHKLTTSDQKMMLDLLGIRADLDLRSSSEVPTPGLSALGDTIAYAHVPIDYKNVSTANNLPLVGQCLRFIIEQLRADHPIYIHCIWGADRTGALCMLLEGLLGVSQSDLDKDYEITSFAGNTRYRNNTYYYRTLSDVRKMPGDSLQQKFRLWWLQTGVTEAELDEFTALMVE